jgi:hypothetical protein
MALLPTIKHQYNILWKKIIDIQMELPYISSARKQCLVNIFIRSFVCRCEALNNSFFFINQKDASAG